MILAPNRWTPAKISSCVMWFRASVGVTTVGGVVTAATEQSSFRRSLSVTGSPTLIANAIGSMPGVRFNAAGDSLYHTDRLFASGAARQIITVCRALTGPGGYQGQGGTIFSCPRGAGASWTAQMMKQITPSVLRGYTDGVAQDVRISENDTIYDTPFIVNWRMTAERVLSLSLNGSARTLVNGNSALERDDVGFTIGNRTDAGAGQYFGGYLCDSLAFSEVLSTPNERAVLQFFSNFYGITVA